MSIESGPKGRDFYSMRSELLPTVDEIADLAQRLAGRRRVTEPAVARARRHIDDTRTRWDRRVAQPPDF